ncbi:MAG: DUF4184 family protein [Candidatus Thorarchaeota archaeon]
MFSAAVCNPLAWAISKADKRMILPGLVVGAVIPDIECLILWYFFRGILPDHLVLHSLIGGLLLGTLLAVFVTLIFYPPIISGIFKVDKRRLKDACKFTPMLVVSCFIGVASHLLLDYTHHWYNPILWPWVDPYLFVGPLVQLFAFDGDIIGTGSPAAQLLVHSLMLIWWVAIILKYRKDNLWENVWLGDGTPKEDEIIQHQK